MTPEHMVVEDGAQEEGTRTPARSSWVLAAVAFGLGVALGTIIGSPQSPSPPTPSVVERVADTGPAEPLADGSGGVASVVPDFPDALVAVEDDAGSGLIHVLWPVGGAPISRSMTAGSNLRFDVAGSYLAMTNTVPGLGGQVLSLGRFNSIRPVVAEVTSYAWHDSRSGRLAFTAGMGGESQLYTTSASLAPELVLSGMAQGATVVAWGDWGFAVQERGEVVLLNPNGEFRDREVGIGWASHADGWLLVVDETGVKTLSAGGGVRRIMEGDDSTLRMSAAAFSPDGTKVAIAGMRGVLIVDLANPDNVTEVPPYPADWVAWSSDSRFVNAPAVSGVTIYDTETGESEWVLVGHPIITASVVPLSS